MRTAEPKVTGDEISAAAFPVRARGYLRSTVRSELARIADLHEKGFAPARYAPPGGSGFKGPGLAYDQEAVDRFFATLAREAPPGLCALPEIPDEGRSNGTGPRHPSQLSAAWRQLARDCQAEWLRVSGLPGVRLRCSDGKVTDSSGTVLLNRGSFKVLLATGQVLRIDSERSGPRITDWATGEPVLWIGTGGPQGEWVLYSVLFPGGRCLEFPVRGTRPRDVVMTAVSESGATVMWLRRIGWGRCEAVVNSDCDLTTELLCAIDQAASWVGGYFGGGGG